MNFTVIFAPGTAGIRAAQPYRSGSMPRRTRKCACWLRSTPPCPTFPGCGCATPWNRQPHQEAGILETIGVALRSTATVTLLAGLLVLAGAIAAGHRRRVYDAVVLKVLGATRWRVLRAFLLEYGLLGLVTRRDCRRTRRHRRLGRADPGHALSPWTFLPGTAIGTALLCLAVMLLFGFVGTWQAMRQKPGGPAAQRMTGE